VHHRRRPSGLTVPRGRWWRSLPPPNGEQMGVLCAARVGTGDDFSVHPSRDGDQANCRRTRLVGASGQPARPPRPPQSAAISSPRAAGTHSRSLERPHAGALRLSLEDSRFQRTGPSLAESNRATVRRLLQLPRDTQLLLVVAAEPLGDPVLLQRAARALGQERSARPCVTDEGTDQ
jgi:hypothetical protein